MLALQHPYVVVAPAETVHVEAWPGAGKAVAVIPGLFGGSFTFRKVIPLLATTLWPRNRTASPPCSIR